jgi:hypothetical protein
MSFDVTFENEPEVITGATHVEGLSMNAPAPASKAPAP